MVGLELGGLDGVGGLGIVDRLLGRRLFGCGILFKPQHFHVLASGIEAEDEAERVGYEPVPVL